MTLEQLINMPKHTLKEGVEVPDIPYQNPDTRPIFYEDYIEIIYKEGENEQ